MNRYTIDWVIEGSINFEAETKQEAIEKFDRISQHDLADMGTRERLTDPMTRTEAKAEVGKYYAKNFGEVERGSGNESERGNVEGLERA